MKPAPRHVLFAALAGDPATGVRLVPGTVVHRGEAPDLWWADGLSHRPARGDELPPGVPAGTRCTLPVVDMGRYLAWLRDEGTAAGVEVRRQRVVSPAEVPGDVVVLAAGLASGPLLGDPSGIAVQGQVGLDQP